MFILIWSPHFHWRVFKLCVIICDGSLPDDSLALTNNDSSQWSVGTATSIRARFFVLNERLTIREIIDSTLVYRLHSLISIFLHMRILHVLSMLLTYCYWRIGWHFCHSGDYINNWYWMWLAIFKLQIPQLKSDAYNQCWCWWPALVLLQYVWQRTQWCHFQEWAG